MPPIPPPPPPRFCWYCCWYCCGASEAETNDSVSPSPHTPAAAADTRAAAARTRSAEGTQGPDRNEGRVRFASREAQALLRRAPSWSPGSSSTPLSAPPCGAAAVVVRATSVSRGISRRQGGCAVRRLRTSARAPAAASSAEEVAVKRRHIGERRKLCAHKLSSNTPGIAAARTAAAAAAAGTAAAAAGTSAAGKKA